MGAAPRRVRCGGDGFRGRNPGQGLPDPRSSSHHIMRGMDYANARCKNHGMCEYRYQFGDWHLGQSCRCRNVPIPVADCECEWDYSKARCAALDSCEYRYSPGDMKLEDSCRIKDAGTLA